MRYYDAREKCDANGNGLGVFHYTCSHDNRTYRVGPCAEGCDGHKTKKEAYAHYKEGVMATLKLSEKKEQWPKVKCEVENCNNEGEVEAIVRDDLSPRKMSLCIDHANEETVSKLVNTGYMFGS